LWRGAETIDRGFCEAISRAKRYFLDSLFATGAAHGAHGAALHEGYNAVHAPR